MKFTHISVTFLATLVFVVFPSVVRAEYIDSFIADIELKKDSTADIVERISYVFTEPRHGIFRCIPTIHQEKASSFLKERYIDIAVSSVRMDGTNVPYTIDTAGNETCIKIGDPGFTITDAHQYDISYTVGGAVSYQAYGGAEWYWNVSGNEWEVPIRSIEARVTSGDSILLRERACYRGAVGKTDSCEVATEENGVIHFRGNNFNPGEGVTIAQALDRSKITHDVRERYNAILVFVIIAISFLTIGIYTLYSYKTKFKTGNTIIPQYEPYPEVKPMYAGFLFDKRLDSRDITAGIVYLAEQGFIKIKKIDRKILFIFEVDDFEVELLRPMDELDGTFEKEVLSLIFYNFSTVGSKITLSDLKDNYAQAQANALKFRALERALGEDLKKKGFYTGFDFGASTTKLLLLGGLIVGLSIVLALIASELFVFVAAGIFALFAIFAGGRRTRKGYEALDHLKGFKDFLRVTERERYIFHNAPEKNAEQFMEYLPYAIAFGVEKEWAKTFEGITIPNPGWYDGGGNISTFNAVSLTQSLGGFSSAFGTSSGASASSGGGHSGGGGGGGGGGSW